MLFCNKKLNNLYTSYILIYGDIRGINFVVTSYKY